MITPYKYIITYDYETGGLNPEINPPTEMALVVIDAITLDIIEEFSIMFRPRIDLSFIMPNTLKEAKRIFTALSYTDNEGGKDLKRLSYKGELLTPRTVDLMVEDIDKLVAYMNDVRKDTVFTYDQYLEMLETEHGDIMQIFFNLSYNPEALTVTHMTIEMLLSEGVEMEEGYKQVLEVIEKYSSGVNKPILAGHNIIEFDNKFLEKGFWLIGVDIFKKVRKKMFDTLDEARLKWTEAPAYNLGTVASLLGLTLKEAHRALPDTVANAKVVIAMLRAFRGEGQGQTEYVRRKFNLNY